MTYTTAEDCLEQIPNRFELALAATYRARQLVQDHTPKVDAKDKPIVTALREIASGQVSIEMLKKVPSWVGTRYLVLPGVARCLGHWSFLWFFVDVKAANAPGLRHAYLACFFFAQDSTFRRARTQRAVGGIVREVVRSWAGRFHGPFRAFHCFHRLHAVIRFRL